MPNYTPNEENITTDNAIKTVFSYCDDNGKPIHKAKELFKIEDNFIYYPYSANPIDGSVVTTPKLVPFKNKQISVNFKLL
jgi:hypothetical protein